MFKGFATWRKDLCHLNKTRDNHFMRLGHYFDLLLVVRAGADIGEHVVSGGTRVVRIATRFDGIIGLAEFYIKAIYLFFKLHRKEPFDFILSPIGEEPIGALVRYLSNQRVLLVYDLWDVPGLAVSKFKLTSKELARWLYQRLLRKIIRGGDVVISGVMKDGLSDYDIPNGKIISTENGVLLQDFILNEAVPDFEFWDGAMDKLKLLYVGYVHKTRGAHELIEVARRLLESNANVTIAMVGPSDPGSISEIHALIDNHGLNDVISLRNPVRADMVASIVAGADVCLCPLMNINKFKWSYPVKIYEYLAMGKPVIATDIPGVSHLIKNGINGCLYNPGDTNALYNTISNLQSRPELVSELSKHARESVLDKDWEFIVSTLAYDLNKYLASVLSR